MCVYEEYERDRSLHIRLLFAESVSRSKDDVRFSIKTGSLVWKFADFDKIKSKTIAFSEDMAKQEDITVEEQWQAIRKRLTEMLDQHVPSKTASTHFHQPWIFFFFFLVRAGLL